MQVRAGKLRLSDLDSDCIPGLLFGQDEGEEIENCFASSLPSFVIKRVT